VSWHPTLFVPGGDSTSRPKRIRAGPAQMIGLEDGPPRNINLVREPRCRQMPTRL
jgi:hypothetical protein